MKVFTISFDDGNPNDEKAAEIMIRYGIRGTFYPNYYRLYPFHKKIHKRLEVGSHGTTHEDLRKVELPKLRQIISRKPFEDFLEKKISMFAAPWGYYNDQVIASIREEGYQGIRTTKSDLAYGLPHNWRLNISWLVGKIPPFFEFKKRFDIFLGSDGKMFHLATHVAGIFNFSDFEKICQYIRETGVKTMTNSKIIELGKEEKR